MTDAPAPAPRAGKPAAVRISRQAASSRSRVTQHQARHLAQLIRLLERDALAHFRVPVPSRLPRDRFEDFFKLDSYRLFIEGAYACGFVCRDLRPDNPLETEREQPARAIAGWAFPGVRQYVHYLVRHEVWAGHFSSPIFAALVDGHLQQVADRLDTDDSLYEPA